LQTTRLSPALEGLNSSLAHPPASYRHGYNKFLPIFVFWAIILAPVMLASQSLVLRTRMIA